METFYRPIDCDFYDQLESLSTLRKPCDVYFTDEDGHEQVLHGVIEDIFTKDHQEFLKLRQGDVIRLDRIIRVDANPKRPHAA